MNVEYPYMPCVVNNDTSTFFKVNIGVDCKNPAISMCIDAFNKVKKQYSLSKKDPEGFVYTGEKVELYYKNYAYTIFFYIFFENSEFKNLPDSMIRFLKHYTIKVGDNLCVI